MPSMAVMPTMTLSDYTSLAVFGGRVTSFVTGNVTAGDDVTPGNDPPSNLTIVAPSGKGDADTIFLQPAETASFAGISLDKILAKCS